LRETAGIAAYANRGENVTAADEAEFFHHAVDQAERMARAGDRRDFELRLADAVSNLLPQSAADPRRPDCCRLSPHLTHSTTVPAHP
jgi:hypothetical protein